MMLTQGSICNEWFGIKSFPTLLAINDKHGVRQEFQGNVPREQIIKASYKLDPDFISLVANLIEHCVKSKYGIDKKILLLDIFNKVFPNVSEEDKTIIIKNLQYIYDNGKINKVSYTKNFTSCFGQ